MTYKKGKLEGNKINVNEEKEKQKCNASIIFSIVLIIFLISVLLDHHTVKDFIFLSVGILVGITNLVYHVYYLKKILKHKGERR